MDSTAQPDHEQEESTRLKMRGDERRRSLVNAAYQLLAEKGFEGLRVRDVADRVGVNIATLHYYFSTKDVLVQGVVEHMARMFSTFNVTPVSDAPQPADEQVRQMFAEVQYQLEHSPAMFVVLTELHLHARRNATIQTSVNELLAQWRGYVENVCRAGVVAGIFPADLDVSAAATVIMALLEGYSLRAMTVEQETPLTAIGALLAQWLTK
jgi:AcrR family transcriptional regulator